MFSQFEANLIDDDETQAFLPKGDVSILIEEDESEEVDINGIFAMIPDEILQLVLSYLSVKKLGQIITTNKRFYQNIEKCIPMYEEFDKETFIKKRMPFMMFAKTDQGEGERPGTYRDIRMVLNLDEFYPKIKQLNKLENDKLDAKIFKKDNFCACMLPFVVMLALAIVGMVVAGVILMPENGSSKANLFLAVALPVAVVLIVTGAG